MKILAVGRPREGIDPRRAIAPHAREELAVLWRLHVAGTVREMYSPAGPGAVLVLEADSIPHARDALAGLPLVANGIVDFELIELQPFSAFDALFVSAEEASAGPPP